MIRSTAHPMLTLAATLATLMTMNLVTPARGEAAMKTILVPLPRYGFDPTESAVPWHHLRKAGHRVVFATPDGKPAAADAIMVSGKGLPFYARKSLMADPRAVALYGEMIQSKEFQNPIAHAQMRERDYDALLLVGGHDKGMREAIDSPLVQGVVADFFATSSKPIGAICHGVLTAARTRSKTTGKSVLHGRRTTAVTRPQEYTAWKLTKLQLGDYYRTYPELDRGGQKVMTEDEIKSALASASDFTRGPGYPVPLSRDTEARPDKGFVVVDGNYLSARWPGDANRFASELVKMLSR